MRRLILGTAGHIDHGKTALVRALTGTDTDRLPEEKRRGITIDLGFARLDMPGDVHIGIVDVPGHEAFIRNMLAGATGMDLALLVVAADEGVMPQTREHLAILEFLGVRRLVVALTKADLVEPEWLELVRDEVATLLDSGPWPDAPAQPVSVIDGRGLDELRGLLATGADAVVDRNAADLFRLPVDRVFTVRGTGTVVTGTVWSGQIRRDAQVRILPADVRARVRGIQSHGNDAQEAVAGERAALALAGPARTDLTRGDVLVDADGWATARIVTARIRCARDAAPLRQRQRIRFHLGTAEVLGRIAVLDSTSIEPGSEGWAQVRLESPVVARAGDRFVLRSYSPLQTIGGGVIVEPHAPRRRGLPSPAAAAFGGILTGTPAAASRAAARLAGWSGVPASALPIATGAAPDLLPRAAEEAGLIAVSSTFFDPDHVDRARDLLLETIDAHHAAHPLSPGIHRDELRQALPARTPDGLADAVLVTLTESGVIETQGHAVRRAGWTATLTPDQTHAAADILAFIDQAGFAAPSPTELPEPLRTRADLQDLLRHLVRTAGLEALPQDRFLAATHAARAREQVREALSRQPTMSPGDFRDLFGITRKFLIPLLEHLDRTGVTVRSGDARHLAGSGRA